MGHVVDDILVDLQVVGLEGQRVELQTQLVLAAATSWWCFSTFTPIAP
jgi:hypothetical protein